jgi:signal recognition particle subunit SRP68
METPDEEEIQETEEDLTSYNIKILPLTHQLHQKHGLRHNDYQRYRQYCARRIARVRKATKMVQGERKKFTKKEVTLDTLKEEKHLQIPLMTVERAWAYAMQLKFEMNTEPRKKYHMINRLRKADKECRKLEDIVMNSEQCNARTKLEAQAYRAWISGTLFFELQVKMEVDSLI